MAQVRLLEESRSTMMNETRHIRMETPVSHWHVDQHIGGYYR